MADGRVLVIGATGTVGRAVVAGLAARGALVRGATRRLDAVSRSGGRAAEWVEFDLERPETFGPALEGVDRVFLMARPGDPEPDRVAPPLVEEMRGRGIRRVVNLTAMGVEERDDVALRRVERLLEDGGFAYTHLRPNWFMQVFADGPLQAGILATGELRVPAGDARISYVDARDVAAWAAAALDESGHEGRAYTLTGGEALDHATIAALLSEASGRSIAYVPLDEDETRDVVVRAGLGPERAERLIGFYRLVRAGYCAPVSGDVAAVLGRPPISFRRFAEDHRARWSHTAAGEMG